MKIIRGLNKLKSNSVLKENNFNVSVIIPFRNESETIIENLRCLENQNYPIDKFEVIYIDDGSTDDSLEKLKRSISKNNISVYSVEATDYDRAHKKRAIELGIEKAAGDIILFTDADSTNESGWIKTMMNVFESDTGFVAGPVSFYSKNSFFGKLQRLEFAGLILSGAGLIGNNTPIICSSANLAFRKTVFNDVGGYENLLGLSSGDDELLMQKIAYDTDYKVKFCFNKDALVKTQANRSIGEFNQQRKRWASKSLFYKNKKIVVKLFMIFLFYLSLIAQLLIGLFWDTTFLYTLLISFVAKVVVEYTIIKKGLGFLYEKISVVLFLIAELLHVPYIIYSAIGGAFGNFTWKGRELKR
ncbi:MAG: glycosyltransferase [Bacteroidota bacterium]